ncbi:DsbA family protein [Streptomyces sp. TRM 70361]|uniref:DsbA family oxidoreductase n=1 Tax=Streptomyces sp. TRM 70361 TaxID=3116553 RepID=UPI002E7C1EDC|nr:DsbA family protein [Streptomyces sp. TRM 70361]MEE1940139.1 DsbA family protein [Streptomyces sp. TRM 70361]
MTVLGTARDDDTPVVTVWSDISCPWATLALHTLHRAAERLALPVLVDHRAFPLELFNGVPNPKYIVDAEVAVIAGRLPELGWRRWSAPEWTYPVTLLPAMEAVQAAKDPGIGGLRGSDELDAALRRAYYTDSRCVSVPAVILDVAGQCPHVDAGRLAEALARGAGRAEVYEQWRTARGPEIQGSPHLFAPGGYRAHNPGAVYAWHGDPLKGDGFPRLDDYRPEWAEELLRRLHRAGDSSRSGGAGSSRPTSERSTG